MTLNSELKEVFKEFNIDPAHGILCLLSVYHNIRLSGELEKVLQPAMMQINVSKIIEKDYRLQGDITWNITLYEGEDKEWNWINSEYRPLFKAFNPLKAGSNSSCVRKMKEFFKKHPAVRKQDVIEAAKLYIKSVNDPTYLQQADYFIFKNSDTRSSFTSRLEEFLEILNDTRVPSEKVNYNLMT